MKSWGRIAVNYIVYTIYWIRFPSTRAADAALRCLGWEGRLIVVGFASGRIPAIPANLLLVKNVAAIGLFWGAYRARNPDKLAASLDALLNWWDQGVLKPLVSERYKLARAARSRSK
jgi:NADPH:quinone reductase